MFDLMTRSECSAKLADSLCEVPKDPDRLVVA